MTAYLKPRSDEWVQPQRKAYKLMCCDCGLVHELDFRVYGGRVQFRARRNERSTAVARRNKPLWSRLRAAPDRAAAAGAKEA